MKENEKPTERKESPDSMAPQGMDDSRQEMSPEMKQRELDRQRYREEMAQRMPPPEQRRRPRGRAGRAMFRLRRSFARKRRALLIALVVALSGVLLMISILIIQYITISQGISSNPNQDGTRDPSGQDTRVAVKIMEITDPVEIVHPMLRAYADKDSKRTVQEIMSVYKMTKQRADGDTPVELSYMVDNLPSSQQIRSVRFLLSENEDYSEPRVRYADAAREGKVTFSHLKGGTLYFYKVVVTLNDATTLETESFFRTVSGSPRFLSITSDSGTMLPNIRDIGGWMTVNASDGTQMIIRQGMVYRGCELDGFNDSACVISQEEGVSDMLSVLGIRTEMDLRGQNGVTGYSALGYNVNRYCIQTSFYDQENRKFVYYNNTSTKAERETIISGIRQAFAILADESNYPIYIHDVYGCDETGMICYLLEAALGVDDAQLKKDFDMSAFSLYTTSTYMYSGVNTMLRSYGSGNSTQERVTDFLINTCGVPAGDLLHIREILLEAVAE